MGQFGIGQPVRRFEDKHLLYGNGRSQNDVTLPGQAYGYVLRSPHAHACRAPRNGHYTMPPDPRGETWRRVILAICVAEPFSESGPAGEL